MVARPEIKGGLREASGDEATVMRSALPRFLALYATLFAAFGVASPFFAAFLAERGLRPEAIGLVLAAGTAVRLVAGPAGGRLADRLGSASVGAGGVCGGGVVRGVRLPASRGGLGFPAGQRGACDDAGAVDADRRRPDVGGSGSLEGSGDRATLRVWLGAGRGVGGVHHRHAGCRGRRSAGVGLAAIIWLNGVLLGVTAWCAWGVPDLLARKVSLARERAVGAGSLLRLPAFRRLMLVAALIQGSHALHDGFVVIHWRSLGIGDGTIGVLWSERLRLRYWCSC